MQKVAALQDRGFHTCEKPPRAAALHTRFSELDVQYIEVIFPIFVMTGRNTQFFHFPDFSKKLAGLSVSFLQNHLSLSAIESRSALDPDSILLNTIHLPMIGSSLAH